MRRALVVAVLFGSMGCATILRGQSRELTVTGPPGLTILDGNEALVARNEPLAGAARIYHLDVDKKLEKVTLRSETQEASAELPYSVAWRWLFIDLFLSGEIGLAVDAIAGSLRDFENLDTARLEWRPRGGVAGAPQPEPGWHSSGAPPGWHAPAQASTLEGKLAVLDFRGYSGDLESQAVLSLSDVVRGAAMKAAPKLDVLTREQQIKDGGEAAAHCEGDCAAEAGRRAGAILVVSGEMFHAAGQYRVSLELRQARDGAVVATAAASGATVAELGASLERATATLLAR